MRLGLSISIALHLIITLLMVVGVPFLKEPLLVPQPIPVEVVDISELTQATAAANKSKPTDKPEPPEPVKPRPVTPTTTPPPPPPAPSQQARAETPPLKLPEPPKVEQITPRQAPPKPTTPPQESRTLPPPPKEEEPEPKPEPPKPQPPKPEPPKPEPPKPEPPKPEPPKPEPPKPEPVKEEPAKEEPKPSPKPPVSRPANIKPAPQTAEETKPETKPTDRSFDNVLKNVLQTKPAEEAKTDPNATRTEPTRQQAQPDARIGDKLTATELDAVRGAVQRCWAAPVGARDIETMVAEIRVTMAPDGAVQKAEVLDSGRYSRDPVFRTLADSARRALLRCRTLPLPADKYEEWKTIVFPFSPRDMF